MDEWRSALRHWSASFTSTIPTTPRILCSEMAPAEPALLGLNRQRHGAHRGGPLGQFFPVFSRACRLFADTPDVPGVPGARARAAAHGRADKPSELGDGTESTSRLVGRGMDRGQLELIVTDHKPAYCRRQAARGIDETTKEKKTEAASSSNC